ncbi:MAG: WbqC family protein [Bacillota bacterium]
MKKVAVIQSNYIPWKGYFDIIHDVDLFIFYDDVQFTTRDWRNRNKIKTPGGTFWLTIPVGADVNRLICEVPITDFRWAIKHWKTIEQFYSKASYFNKYKDFLTYVYLEKKWSYLSEINQFIIKKISKDFLGIKTEFMDSRELCASGKKTDRLLDIVEKVGADTYISGPAAKNYIDEKKFEEAEIKLEYKDYSGYPEYPQFHPPFTHSVSILDLLFHVGPDAPYYIWGWRENVI